ncbi:MAG: aminotransferase class I/II-fold pyridoxal phosphate-dependent enzyme [Hornefia sp.]|nr:aminotransferase class I/II-fold pyridoxal phosphate-dependent enzyme [Hornefia sp.]
MTKKTNEIKYIMSQQNGRRITKEDVIFGINKRAGEMIKEKGAENVVNGTIGALLDDDGELMVLSSVDGAFRSLSPKEYAAYAPIGGTPEFRSAAIRAALKGFKPKTACIRAVSTPGGTGSLRNVIVNYSCPGDKLLTTDWHWSPYNTIAEEHGRSFTTFKLFDEAKKFNVEALKSKADELLEKQNQLIIFINTPAQNPTGYSLTNEDWEKTVEYLNTVPADKKVTLLVDTAYIDFAGDEDEYRSFLPYLEQVPPNVLPVLAFSMSKTFTLYGLRCGAMICFAASEAVADEFVSVCEYSSRGAWSNSPRAGQEIIAKIFADPRLLEKVTEERKEIRDMLLARAKAFEDEAKRAGLNILPFDGGFFISVPCKDPVAAGRELEKEGIFIVPLAMGLRVSIASISEEKCKMIPERILAAITKTREDK